MRVTGIIAECNPLHEGHRYLIRRAREETGADYIVIALSGDYVQRGAPAILSREARTRALLKAGADLVVEIPLYAACGGADYFARGAVALMESLGVVTDLAFGSESGDTQALMRAAEQISRAEESEDFRRALSGGLREGLSYPAARAGAVTGFPLPDTPNDLLGAEYLRALRKSGSSIKPLAVTRISCSSATRIRAGMIADRGESDPCLCRDDFSDLLLHALYRARSAEDLACYLDVSRDLASRIVRELPDYKSYSGFCAALKTRNYTYTRISRALLHILLGMTNEKMQTFDRKYGLCGWIRPIGFKKSAAPLIHAVSASCTVPFLARLSRSRDLLPDDLAAILDEELRAEFLYDLMAAGRSGGRAPYAPGKPLVIQDDNGKELS